MRDLIAELEGGSFVSTRSRGRDLIAEMGGEMPKPTVTPYGPSFWDNLLKGGGAELETLSDPSNPEAAAVVAATGGSLAMMPVAGMAGLAKTITSGVTEGGKTLEQIGGIPARLIQTPEQQRAAGEIGKLMEPFQMAGRGIGGIVEGVTSPAIDPQTGMKVFNWNAANEVVQGTSGGSNIAVPVGKAIGEISAMFALPGTPKAAKAWWNNLPYRKRVMVVEQVQADIANGEFTGAELRKLWKDPANREALLKRYQGVGEEAKPAAPRDVIAELGEPPKSPSLPRRCRRGIQEQAGRS